MTDEQLLRALVDEIRRLEQQFEYLAQDVLNDFGEPLVMRGCDADVSLLIRAECRLAQLERDAIEALPDAPQPQQERTHA